MKHGAGGVNTKPLAHLFCALPSADHQPACWPWSSRAYRTL